MNIKKIKTDIEKAWNNRFEIDSYDLKNEIKKSVDIVISYLDEGKIRVAENNKNKWVVNTWIKKAILLAFIINNNKLIGKDNFIYYDKIDLKFNKFSKDEFKKFNYRIVPQATIRKGSFLGKNVILMPSYVNIGSYIGEGTMIDTWSTVGSCAQIGKNVHLSGGVGIGGVLEPLQSNPTIIEDNCFIGARSEIVEGVIVEKNSVISMGVYLSQSTKIYDRISKKIIYGRIPSGSVVIPGSLPSNNKLYNLNCAIIVKKVDEQTIKKTSINEILRI